MKGLWVSREGCEGVDGEVGDWTVDANGSNKPLVLCQFCTERPARCARAARRGLQICDVE